MMLVAIRPVVEALASLFDKEYCPIVSHSRNGMDLEARVNVYRPLVFRGFTIPFLKGKRVASLSIHSNLVFFGRYHDEASINWLDSSCSGLYSSRVNDLFQQHNVRVTGASIVR